MTINQNNKYFIRLPGESLDTVLDSIVGGFEDMREAIAYAHDELPEGAEFSVYDPDFKIDMYAGVVTGKNVLVGETSNENSGLLGLQ